MTVLACAMIVEVLVVVTALAVTVVVPVVHNEVLVDCGMVLDSVLVRVLVVVISTTDVATTVEVVSV